MMSDRFCKKCEKMHSPSTMFCPHCGSLTTPLQKPETPSPTRSRRAVAKAAPVLAIPEQRAPVKVRMEHSREDLFLAMATKGIADEDIDVVNRLLSWADGVASSMTYGNTVAEGGRVGFRPLICFGDREVSLFWVGAEGRIEVHFDQWLDIPPFDSRRRRVEMLGRLNAIKGVKIAEASIAARPPLPVKALRDRAEMNKFIKAFEWLIAQARGQ